MTEATTKKRKRGNMYQITLSDERSTEYLIHQFFLSKGKNSGVPKQALIRGALAMINEEGFTLDDIPSPPVKRVVEKVAEPESEPEREEDGEGEGVVFEFNYLAGHSSGQ